MTYNKRVKKIIEKLRNFNPYVFYDKVMNRLSTGGEIERKMKKHIADVAHPGGDRSNNRNEKYYKAIEKAYSLINNERE